MKKRGFLCYLILSLVLVSAFVSCSIEKTSMVTGAYKENPFLTPRVIPSTGGEVSFLLISDEHIGKTTSGASHSLTNLYAYMDEQAFPFAVSLGDLSDDGKLTDAVTSFISNMTNRTTNKIFLQCVGNHDRHEYGSSYASQLENAHMSMCRYVCGDLSMYVLDNSTRTFTEKQFAWLEEALKADTSRYKIFFAHENICAGTDLSHTQVMIGFADVSEMNYLFGLMDEYKVGLLFTGHTHKGDIVYDSPDGNYAEYNICSFVKTNSILEPGDNWYRVTVNMSNGKTVVECYNGTTLKIDTTREFVLPAGK